MKITFSAQIWRSANGVERVWGFGTPEDKSFKPLLDGSRHTYVRNEDRDWVTHEILK